MDLIEFLRDRLDWDEAFAIGWRNGGREYVRSGFPADPERMLAEIEAKRRALLTRDQGVCTCSEYESPPTDPDTREPIPHHYDCAAYEAALMFVQVYADHPGLRPLLASSAPGRV